MTVQRQQEVNELLRRVFIEEAGLLLGKCEGFLRDDDSATAGARVGAAFRLVQTLSASVAELGFAHLNEPSRNAREALDAARLFPDKVPADFLKLMSSMVASLARVIASGDQGPGLEELNALSAKVVAATRDFRAMTEKLVREGGLYGLPISIDTVFRTVSRGPNAKVVLTSKELQIMSMLEAATDKTVQRNELVGTVWGDVRCCTKTFGVHMLNLRRKISPIGLAIRFVPPDLYRLVDAPGDGDAL